MNKNKDFHPKLILVDHFDDVVNQIDVKTETILQSQEMNEIDRSLLNDLRKIQLKEIDKVKKENLSYVVFDEDSYKLKWNSLINDETLTFEQKAEAIKSSLVFKDCILIEEDNNINSGLTLWILPWFCDQIHLKFLRYLTIFHLKILLFNLI